MDKDEYLYNIKGYYFIFRCPPTIRELAYLMGITSTSVVSRHLKKLEAAGLILPRQKNQRRAIIPSNIRITFE